MTSGILAEAYQRLHHAGPEWDDNSLTNHGPMTVEVMVRRGHAADVHPWVDAYVKRLDDLPAASDRITEDTWREALGKADRIADWTAYLTEATREAHWRDLLATWWPRLLPAIAAGTTHGVIRVSHAVRALVDGEENAETSTELAHGLAFWAARARYVPGVVPPGGRLDARAALHALPRVPEQRGNVANRFRQLAEMADWPASLTALHAPTDPDDTRRVLTELVDAAAVHYLGHGHPSPVLLVHTATAPNAVLPASCGRTASPRRGRPARRSPSAGRPACRRRVATCPRRRQARGRWPTCSTAPSRTATSTSSSSPTPRRRCTRAPATRTRSPPACGSPL